MAVEKDRIIKEIQRTAKANGGAALGWRRFEDETGIRYYDWYPHFWMRWGDAVREAGLEPNRMAKAYDDRFLLEKLILLTRRLGGVPTSGDLILAARNILAFPSGAMARPLVTAERAVAGLFGLAMREVRIEGASRMAARCVLPSTKGASQFQPRATPWGHLPIHTIQP